MTELGEVSSKTLVKKIIVEILARERIPKNSMQTRRKQMGEIKQRKFQQKKQEIFWTKKTCEDKIQQKTFF